MLLGVAVVAGGRRDVLLVPLVSHRFGSGYEEYHGGCGRLVVVVEAAVDGRLVSMHVDTTRTHDTGTPHRQLHYTL